jgi:hypothetical protein
VNGLRKITLDIPIAEVAISTDALIGRAKEFAAVKMEQFVAPVIKFAMRDLYGMIFAYRKTAITNKALTMEVHLRSCRPCSRACSATCSSRSGTWCSSAPSKR